MKRLLFGLSLIGLGVGCADDVTGPTLLNGTYRYTATDSAGTELLIGQLDLAFHTDSTISGTWIIDWAPEADQNTAVGPQVGEGTLEGLLAADGVVIDLNPNVADDNVFLYGAFDLESEWTGLDGGWGHSTLTGPVAAGYFTALPLLPD
jgi:hypothetical protein